MELRKGSVREDRLGYRKVDALRRELQLRKIEIVIMNECRPLDRKDVPTEFLIKTSFNELPVGFQSEVPSGLEEWDQDAGRTQGAAPDLE
jgi:hypothetical protein